MLRVLIICTLFAVALCHENSDESNEHSKEKRGHCPNVASNVTAADCATPCPPGTNCTFVNCSSDTNCTGGQKCCQTNCGLKCVDPEFKTICSEDDDCPATLVCCKKSCVAVCGKPMPPKKNESNSKGKKKKY